MSRRKSSDDGGCGLIVFAVLFGGFMIYAYTSIYVLIIIIVAVVSIIIGLVIRNRRKAQEFERNMLYSISDIDVMSGEQFEYAFARTLRRNGYTDVRVTQTSGDDGIDILACNNGIRIGFQCKRYDQHVGNSAVQQAFSGRQMYNLDKTIVVTNNYFTESAINTAKVTGVELWDRNKLISMLGSGIYDPDAVPNYSTTPLLNNSSEEQNSIATQNRFVATTDNTKSIDVQLPIGKKTIAEETYMYDPIAGKYPSGDYVVGEDIPVGKYVLTSRNNGYGFIYLYNSNDDYEQNNSFRSRDFKGDYFVNLRKEGVVISVLNADMQRISNSKQTTISSSNYTLSFSDCQDAKAILNLIMEHPESSFHTKTVIHDLQKIVKSERFHGNMKHDAIKILDKVSNFENG